MRLYRRESGTPESARLGTIVFIHGFPLTSEIWQPQLGSLPDGWRGIAPDLRGFGQSPLDAAPEEIPTGKRLGGRIARDDEPVLTMASLADDIALLLERESGDRPEHGLSDHGAAVNHGAAVICGLSMGGYVALELWRRHPALVRGLVLADTRAAADDDEGRENRMRMALKARDAGLRPIASAMLPSLLAPETATHDPDLVDRVRRMILDTPVPTLVAALAGMAARHDATRDLPGIRTPTLVIAGEHDAITPPDTARAMADALPDARLAIVQGAGHLANLENPDAFNAALHDFLEELAP